MHIKSTFRSDCATNRGRAATNKEGLSDAGPQNFMLAILVVGRQNVDEHEQLCTLGGRGWAKTGGGGGGQRQSNSVIKIVILEHSKFGRLQDAFHLI